MKGWCSACRFGALTEASNVRSSRAAGAACRMHSLQLRVSRGLWEAVLMRPKPSSAALTWSMKVLMGAVARWPNMRVSVPHHWVNFTLYLHRIKEVNRALSGVMRCLEQCRSAADGAGPSCSIQKLGIGGGGGDKAGIAPA